MQPTKPHSDDVDDFLPELSRLNLECNISILIASVSSKFAMGLIQKLRLFHCSGLLFGI